MKKRQKPAKPWKHAVKEMIGKFDKDGDGKLNEEERKAAMAARPNQVKEENPKVREKKKRVRKRKREKGKEITKSFLYYFTKMPPRRHFFKKWQFLRLLFTPSNSSFNKNT